MKKKVLILGASSDIGIEILRMYRGNYYDVIAHYNSGNKKFFNFVKTHNIKKVKFNFLSNFKLIDNFSKNKIFKNCDILINAIGNIKQKKYSEISSKGSY
jgi:Short-chain dehydrogenases of various substrate specificities